MHEVFEVEWQKQHWVPSFLDPKFCDSETWQSRPHAFGPVQRLVDVWQSYQEPAWLRYSPLLLAW